MEREAARDSLRSERESELERSKGLVFKNPRCGVCSSCWPQARGSAMEALFEKRVRKKEMELRL